MSTEMTKEQSAQSSQAMFDDEATVDAGSAQEYLAFGSGGLLFIVNAANIIEIIMHHNITTVPMVPEFIKGVINLRGQIIPIIDMRLRMNKPPIEYNEEACVIVIDVNSVTIGLLVESVLHVVDVRCEDIAPPLSKNTQEELVNGIVRIDNEVYLVLDCDLVIQCNDENTNLLKKKA